MRICRDDNKDRTDTTLSWFIKYVALCSVHHVKYSTVVIWCASFFCFFYSQFLQRVDFKITSKIFPMGSKHASAIHVLDDQPKLFQDPSKLALVSILWLIAFSKLESCSVFCKYNFSFSASSFNFSSNSISNCNEIDSAWLFQLCGLISLSILKILATFLAPQWPYPIKRKGSFAARLMSKKWLLFGVIGLYVSLLDSQLSVLHSNFHILPKPWLLTISSKSKSFPP